MFTCPKKTGSTNQSFRVYNAVLGTDSPDIDKRMTIVYEGAFNIDDQALPDSAGYDSAVQNIADSRAIPAWANHDNHLMIDVERYLLWPWVENAAHEANADKYSAIAQEMKSRLPQEMIGLYGVYPQGGISVSDQIQGNAARRAAWVSHNLYTANAIIDYVDILCPPYYSFYQPSDTSDAQFNLRLDQWIQFVDEHNALARSQLPGKPIYPLVWPQYHSGGGVSGWPYVSDRMWRAQLEHIKATCDGVVLWGLLTSAGVQPPPGSWDESSSWWAIFKDVFNVA